MSFLRYAKSGHVERHRRVQHTAQNPPQHGSQPKQQRPQPSRSSGQRSSGQRSGGQRTQPRSQQSTQRMQRDGGVHRKGPLTTLVLCGLVALGVGALSFVLQLSTASSAEQSAQEVSATETTMPSPASSLEVIAEAERLHQAAHGELPVANDMDDDTEALPTSPKPTAHAAQTPAPAPVATTTATVSVTDQIRRGETLSFALTRHGITIDQINALVAGLKGVVDVRAIRPGDAYTIAEEVTVEPGQAAPEDPQTMARFEFRPSSLAFGPTVVIATRHVDAKKGATTYKAEKRVAPIETKVVALKGEVNSSLYVTMKEQGEGSALVNAFADVFAWNIDFYRETKKGDKYKVVVEKQYAEGRFIGYGKVLAAEYVNAGEIHRGFDFRSADGKIIGVFDDKGSSLERTFLKSPMEVTRVTSRFGQRFHPVLKQWRDHNGIDYGAASGTPFWAVADGVVKEAHYSNTAGNMIVLRHANGYETEYFHASKFAKDLKAGMKVRQRQVIGYVGSTGRSTGPHLHFGMRKKGSVIDPKKQSFPSAKPVPQKYVEEFVRSIADLRAELEALEVS